MSNILNATRRNSGKAMLRATGARILGGAATQALIDAAVYSTTTQHAAMGETVTLERIAQTAVAELVNLLRHFRLDEDVLRALQTPASMSDSVPLAGALQPASPQSAADQ